MINLSLAGSRISAWNAWNVQISWWNAHISHGFRLKCSKNSWFQLKYGIIFGIFEESILKTMIWNAPKMHAFQLEMHERPIPVVVILLKFWGTFIVVHILELARGYFATKMKNISSSWLLVFAKERPILDHHAKAHIHEIRRISCGFHLKSTRFHVDFTWNLPDFVWSFTWNPPDFTCWNPPDFTCWNPADFERHNCQEW